MQLRDLDSKTFDITVALVQTSSVQLSILIHDKLKKRYNCTAASTIVVANKKDLKKVREVATIVPFVGSKWFVEVDLEKAMDKELYNLIQTSTTCLFYCTSTKYQTFKKFKEGLKNQAGVVDLYINYIRRPDLLYLYDTLVPKNNLLSKPLFDYVAQSYSSDIDAIMDLFMSLGRGDTFESRKDIAELCGIGNNSVDSFLLALIKPPSDSGKGVCTVIRNRVKAGIDLGAAVGWSSFYNFLNSALTAFIYIKVLKISGVLYKTIPELPASYDSDNNLIAGYDEAKLSRYNKYIWRLDEVPLSRLLRIKQTMLDGTKWKKQADFLCFIYNYYLESVKQEVLNVNNS